jgi:hypothetical protein
MVPPTYLSPINFFFLATVICVSNKEEIVFRNGNTKEELDIAEPDSVQESDSKRFRSESPTFSSNSSYSSSSSYESEPVEQNNPTADHLPPTSNYYQEMAPNNFQVEKNGYNGGFNLNSVNVSAHRGAFQSKHERTVSPQNTSNASPPITSNQMKIDLFPEEREIFLLYKKLEVTRFCSNHLIFGSPSNWSLNITILFDLPEFV